VKRNVLIMQGLWDNRCLSTNTC